MRVCISLQANSREADFATLTCRYKPTEIAWNPTTPANGLAAPTVSVQSSRSRGSANNVRTTFSTAVTVIIIVNSLLINTATATGRQAWEAFCRRPTYFGRSIGDAGVVLINDSSSNLTLWWSLRLSAPFLNLTRFYSPTVLTIKCAFFVAFVLRTN